MVAAFHPYSVFEATTARHARAVAEGRRLAEWRRPASTAAARPGADAHDGTGCTPVPLRPTAPPLPIAGRDERRAA